MNQAFGKATLLEFGRDILEKQNIDQGLVGLVIALITAENIPLDLRFQFSRQLARGQHPELNPVFKHEGVLDMIQGR